MQCLKYKLQGVKGGIDNRMDMAQTIFIIFMAVSLSACAGIRAFLPPLAVSLLALSGHITLAPGFAWMGRWDVAAIFGLAALLEIVADKYPGVDHAMDAAGLVLKPVMGALLASSLITGMDPLTALCIGIIVGGATAGIVHLGKAKLRLVSTGFTAGLANPVLSTLEDIGAVIWTVLAISLPYITVLALIVGGVLLARLLSHRRAPRGTVSAGEA
jgi:uncharacterized membrane protein